MKPANTAKSRVLVSELGEGGVSFVRTLISPEDLRRIRKKLREHGWTQRPAGARSEETRTAREIHKACVWLIAPGTGTTIPGADLVVLVFQGASEMRLHVVGTKVGAFRRGDPVRTWHAKSVELVGGGDNVVVSNFGVGKSTLFSVHAADLVRRADG